MSSSNNESEVVEVEELAKQVIKKAKERSKMLYRLAFIATSDLPEAEEARMLLAKMVSLGMFSQRTVNKAIENVQKWRELRYRFERAEITQQERKEEAEEEVRRMIEEIKKRLEEKGGGSEAG
jgi:LPS O-antigen subunit length determinant protein (WzzB/FepE family)